ncbi:hypothetical protein [Arcobacter sp. CECT 8985]|uniref:hypothetical protein n=1 Tax=Arcobacter sp. CECT 8985 TaxID=1935424 RepID=UPI00100A73CB|nr:hypothetical protein [Arcobacter sp. CECT 8985]RXJ85592.1 hypothetical protein CRU93_11260 [Arcobacter sp. CECT 8985]
MTKQISIPNNILKIQKKLCTFEKGSRNYIKYSKILEKHIKKNNMKRRVNSNIKTIEAIQNISKN